MAKKVVPAPAVPAKIVKPDVAVEVKSTGDTLVELAKTLVITDDATLAQAADLLTKAKAAGDRQEAEEKKMTDHLKAAMKVEKERWAPVKAVLKQIADLVKPKVVAYMTALENAKEKQTVKLVAQFDTGKIKKESTLERKLEAIPDAPHAVFSSGGGGSIQSRELETLEITDRDLIPDEFWVIDEVALRKAVVKEKREIPGTKITLKKSIATLF